MIHKWQRIHRELQSILRSTSTLSWKFCATKIVPQCTSSFWATYWARIWPVNDQMSATQNISVIYQIFNVSSIWQNWHLQFIGLFGKLLANFKPSKLNMPILDTRKWLNCWLTNAAVHPLFDNFNLSLTIDIWILECFHFTNFENFLS